MRLKTIIIIVIAIVMMAVLGMSFIKTVVSRPGSGFVSNPNAQLAQVVPASDLCSGYGDDRDYLYNLNTEISTKSDGTETFRLSRRSDGKILRQIFSDERFYTDRSNGNVQTTYDVQEKCGGVDVVYTIRNNSAISQLPPNLEIDGVMQRTTGDFFVLDLRDSGHARNVSRGGGPSNIFLGSSGGENQCCNSTLTYPNFYYAPVVVSHDNDFSAGSSLVYPYLQYKHEIVPQLTKVTSGPQANTWKHEYREFQKYYYSQGTDPTLLRPGEQRTYTVTLRFTQPRSWILTLEPYKKFFKQTYGDVDQVRPQDFRPIFADILAFTELFNRQTSPRGYRTYSHYSGLYTEGWGTWIDTFLGHATGHGFQRSMIWAPSGLYGLDVNCRTPDAPIGFNGQGCNFPPAFMDFLPALSSTAYMFERFQQNNVELGFWWGRSTGVPVPDVWDPPIVETAELTNPDHNAYLDNQLQLAFDRGAKIIGLDAFGGPAHERISRIERMRNQTNNEILFVHEGSGPDILHRRMANFYQPTTYTWWTQFNKNQTVGPDVLSRYINSGSEVWFFFFADEPSCQQVQKMISWGFTPLANTCSGGTFVEAGNLSLDRVGCFDGRDNNNDGRTDWPYDPGCSDAEDDNERSVSSPPPPAPPRPRPASPHPSPTQPAPSTPTPSIAELLQRVRELQAILASLQAQHRSTTRTQTQPVVPPRPYISFSRDLTLGSTGTDVAALQQFLVARGFLVMPAGTGFGSYGTRTRDAVIRLQTFTGISPANGIFGPTTRARVNQLR